MADGEVPRSVVILLVIVGSAAIVAMGYGMHRALSTRLLSNEWSQQ